MKTSEVIDMKQNELKRLVHQARSKDRDTLSLTESKKGNPQVEELRRIAIGRVQAWEAMLDAIENDTISLKIFAGA